MRPSQPDRSHTVTVLVCLAAAFACHGATTITYTYDDADRLTGVAYPGSKSVAYTYNTGSTRTARSATVPGATVTFTSAGQSGSEGVGTMSITVQLSQTVGNTVTVPFTVTGNASGGTDYTITNSPVTIPSGQTETTIDITVVNDTDVEGDETVIVTMGTPTNATQGATTQHTATITDNDVRVSANDATPGTSGDGAADSFGVGISGGQLVVTVGGATAFSGSPGSVHRLVIDGSSDDDTLTVDFGSGDPVPAGGISYVGSGQATGDGLVIEGGSFTDVTYTMDGTDSGTVALDARTIVFTGLEPITDNSSAVNRVFTVSIAGAQQIRLIDDGAPTDGKTRIDSGVATDFEQVVFKNPTTTLTINAGDGNDTLTIDSLDDGLAASTAMNGEAGDDTFRFSNAGVRLPGSVNGGGGADVLDYTGQATVTVTITGTTADGQSGTQVDTLVIGFTGINQFVNVTVSGAGVPLLGPMGVLVFLGGTLLITRRRARLAAME